MNPVALHIGRPTLELEAKPKLEPKKLEATAHLELQKLDAAKLASLKQVAPAASALPPSSAEALHAAREFESIFLRTLLQPLEKTTHSGKGSTLSAGQSAYGGMVVGAMADAMAGAGGIGLAEVVARAMSTHISSPRSDKGGG